MNEFGSYFWLFAGLLGVLWCEPILHEIVLPFTRRRYLRRLFKLFTAYVNSRLCQRSWRLTRFSLGISRPTAVVRVPQQELVIETPN